ncbi:MAG: NAD(P)H-dependent glycerol-3-phosphate dehydrogenase [Clostridia bacterium]|nr:NAD(P)H-dependent glycerol-3-phosphate dehydrogenase [Clostridia bacterium]MBR2926080.1 NAD(P)H-dependent glycerol-3-phosphate dehydrogenase [Clostridia bacterium]
MKITVIGCGRWGTLITWYLDRMGHSVKVYGPADTPHMKALLATRSNDLLTLPESVGLCTDLGEAVEAETIIISINSQGLRALLRDELAPLHLKDKTFVLCMKGLENTTGKRLSQVAREELDPSCSVAVWIGPGHVQEFYRGVPNCMVIDSEDEAVKRRLVDAFASDLIRFYYGQDLLGNEVGAASKNVIGIAAGILDGLGLSTLKGALMSRGTREISRLIGAMGGNPLSAYGLCHLGDYEATVFSHHSHNRAFGENLILGKPNQGLAEGYETAVAMMLLAEQYHVELPICEAVYKILYQQAEPKQVIGELFERSLKQELN